LNRKNRQNNSLQSFWKDDLDSQLISLFPLRILKWVALFYAILIVLLSFGFVYLISPTLAWICAGLVMISIWSGYLRRRRKKVEIQTITQIQQRAQNFTGASLIGSAVHVAAHPQLEREQNIVLALAQPNLLIYSYDTDQPLVSIPIQQITAIQTVVYDDERIPHIDVVDSTAQAIQLTLKFEMQEIKCLFRRMKKVRPIDWYHAIQKARIN